MVEKQQELVNLGKFTDISAVRTDVAMKEIEEMVEIVRNFQCICASPMPWATKWTIDQLEGTPAVVTGVVSFPAGADSIPMKVFTAKEMIRLGCKELDMVMNVSAFKSGNDRLVEDDIRAVIDAANGIPVKVILEICYLTDDEIMRASELAVRAGAAFIKTGTGWGTKPTTADTVKLIRKTIGTAAKIKAAGGVKDLDTLLKLKAYGCDRFGIGVRSAKNIFEEAYRRAGVPLPDCGRQP